MVLRARAARTYIILCVSSCPEQTIELRLVSPSSQKHYAVPRSVSSGPNTDIVGNSLFLNSKMILASLITFGILAQKNPLGYGDGEVSSPIGM